MMQQRVSPGGDPLDESMDNMESLILNPPDYDSLAGSEGMGPDNGMGSASHFDSVSGSGFASASHSYYSHSQDDPLESDFHGFGVPPPLEPPPYHEALDAPRVSSTSNASSPSSSAGGSGGASAGAGPSGSSGSHSATPGKDFILVRVTDIQKHLDSSSSSMLPGGGSYVSYAVVTKTDLQEYGEGRGTITVRRRFREFVALADRLAETHRGYFIPARPDKSVVENQLMPGKDFVEMRRVELEKYLQRLARHPAIRRSPELVLFLTAEGKLPMFPKADVASRVLEGVAKLPGQLLGSAGAASVPAPAEAVQPASGGRDLLRMFKELRQSVANDWVGGGAAAVAAGPPDPHEEEVAARRHKLDELEKHLTEASIHAENLVRAQADVTRLTGNLGLSFMALSKMQQRAVQGTPLWGATPGQLDTQRQLADLAKAGAHVLVKESRLHQQAVSESISQLAQFHEYIKGLQAARAAFNDRSQAVVTLQTLTGDLAAKRAKLDRLNAGGPRPGDISRVKRAIDIEEEIDKAQKAKAAAEGELQRIRERNFVELERFDAERRQDMSAMLESFARIQAVASERTIQLWESASDIGPSAKGKGKEAILT